MNPQYVLRRLLIAAFSLFAGVSLVFMIIHMIPGDPVRAMLGDMYTEQAAVEIRRTLGLDRPVYVQYFDFMSGLPRGDLGTSFATRQAVAPEVFGSLQYTVQLALAAIVVTVVLGVPAGIVAALNRDRPLDTIAMAGSLLGASMPSFWLGILLMILFSIYLGWLPLIGVGSWTNPLSMLAHVALPALTLGIRGAALTARVTRSSMLEVLSQDYMRTATAKGLRNRVVVTQHGLRNAMLPVVTLVGIDLGQLLAGTAIVEIVFSRPGLGSLLVQSVLVRDYPMVQGTFIVYLTLIILVNLIVDLLYGRLDPRVTYQ